MATELLSVSELRSHVLRLIQNLEHVPERYIITRDGRPSAVLLGYDEFKSILATLETVLDPEMVKGIKEGLRDKKTRRIKSFEEVFGEPL
ncbi:MAG: type II toxin-antitoxin system Phd/YefM family antitoxin [Elusimicrobiota bacterium]|nr:type II toxin-antitoxin system Phd/YefM family antitoxin [Elusimicrobiota bacterium]